MKDYSGWCDDWSCGCRSADGYCRLTACIKSPATVTTTNTSGDIRVITVSSITDDEMKNAIDLYLKDHAVPDLLKLIADTM